jgi:ribosomal protein S18 acetylase RimI-like enzyme
VKIDTLAQHSANVLPLIREIFFLSADPKNVSEDPLKNEAFFERWTGYYLKNSPEWTLLAWDEGRLLGYLMYEIDSTKVLKHFQIRMPSYGLFADQFAEFPAHLHVNCHPEARGKGVGTALINELCTRLGEKNLSGVHLITSRTQRNVEFYRRNGFNIEIEREWRGQSLFFMGKKLQTAAATDPVI